MDSLPGFRAAVRWLIARDDIAGVVNVAAPHPLPNAEFMRDASRGVRRPVRAPGDEWMLEIGAVFMRTETELILKSRRVVPARLLEHGFRFKYPDWNGAPQPTCVVNGEPSITKDGPRDVTARDPGRAFVASPW